MELALNLSNNLGGFASELITAGVPSPAIADITALANDYIPVFKNQNQHISKVTSVTDDQQTELNEIFFEAKSISAIGQNVYRKDTKMSRLFTFSCIVKKYTQSRPKTQGNTAAISKPIENITPPQSEDDTVSDQNKTEPGNPPVVN
jgi:hypothetical protein